MKKYIFVTGILLYHLSHAQIYNNKQSYAKIDRLDSIEDFLESFTRQQSLRNNDLMQVTTQTKEINRNYTKIKQRLEILERENLKLKNQLIKIQTQKTKVIKVDSNGNKVISDDDPDRAVLLKELNELRLKLKDEKESSDKKLLELETTIKNMQAIILRNEKQKGIPKP